MLAERAISLLITGMALNLDNDHNGSQLR
jgi:hypothetical protein